MEQVKVKVATKTDTLKDLGFKKAAEILDKTKEFKKKTSIAYEHFRYVTPDKFQKFNDDLRKRTDKSNKQYYQYDRLVFTDIKDYAEVPPQETLTKLQEAKDLKCFDTYEIAKIESVKELVDPILFGVIHGCPDKFFISQWDNDVKIEDILKENEG